MKNQEQKKSPAETGDKTQRTNSMTNSNDQVILEQVENFIYDEKPITHYSQIPNILHEMLASGEISIYAFSLYCAYKRTCGQEGNCWKSMRTLSKELNISMSTVSSARKELERKFDILGGKSLIRIKRMPKKSEKADVVVIVDVWNENHAFFKKKLTCSYSEHGCSYSEHGCSPGEHKNNPVKNNHMKKVGESKDSPCAEAQKGGDDQPPSDAKKDGRLRIDKKTFKLQNLTSEKYEELKKIAPSIDLFSEISRIEEWLKEHPTRAKGYKNVEKFLNTWLKKAEEDYHAREKAARQRELQKKYQKKGGHTPTESTPPRKLSKEELEYNERIQRTVIKIGDPEKVEQEWRERMRNSIINLDELKKKESEKK